MALKEYRQHLHTIPEIGFDLFETGEYICEVLRGTRAEVSRTAGTGVLAYFDFGKEYTVAFRADMDALNIEEEASRALRSCHPGRMHACGHDSHMAMALETAMRVNEMKDARANVLVVFQPSEETNGGGGVVVRENVLERYNVKEIYAIHVDPVLPKGMVAIRSGPMMAMAEEMTVTVRGKSVHVAKYRTGADSIEAMSRFLCGAYAAPKALEEGTRYLLRFGTLEAGTARNILAETAVLKGSVRGYSGETLRILKDRMAQAAKEADEACGTQTTIEYAPGYPPLINSDELYRKAKRVVKGFAELEEPSLLAEDFAFYTERVPGLMMFLGLGTGNPLHSKEFLVDDDALPTGVEAFLSLLADE